jgi:ketosteroid isomerase-like protein
MTKSMARHCFVSIGLLFTGLALSAPKSLTGDDYLTPHLRVSESYSNVFAIAHAVKAQGFDEYVRRNGGSGDYTVISASNDAWQFRGSYHYDGQEPVSIGELRDGGRTACNDGKCVPYDDGTGLLYNPTLWGKPPKHLEAGVSWTMNLEKPWELGGPNGTQTVTVIHVDPATATATLRREGTSEGFFADEPAQLKMVRSGQTVVLNLVPGETHWKGYATFTKGVVISDELVATRKDILRGDGGKDVQATERRIMILNAAPWPAEPGETARTGVAPTVGANMSDETRNRLVYDAFARAWVAKDIDALMNLVANDITFAASVGPEPGRTYRGRAAARQSFLDILAYDDALGVHPGKVAFADGRLFAEWAYDTRDTQGKRQLTRGIDIFEFRDGQIVLKDAFRKAPAEARQHSLDSIALPEALR